MDGDKGVMMAQRPSGDGGVSVGNYKGVMLCNRPFGGGPTAGGAGKVASSSGDGGSMFKVGVKKEVTHPRGWDPAMKERLLTKPQREKKETALTRHKQWLRDFQAQREDLKAKMLEEIREREAKRQKFREAQAKARQEITGMLSPDDDAAYPDEGAAGRAAQETAEKTKAASDRVEFKEEKQEKQEEDRKPNLSKQQQRKLKKKNRPAWAMTEEMKEEKEEHDVEDLLRFAENLDFDEYVNDIEVRAALEQAKKRIEELESARTSEFMTSDGEEDEEGDSDEQGPKKKQPTKLGKLTAENLKHLENDDKENVDEDLVSMADTVMSSAQSIRSVHSKRSLAAVIERQKQKRQTTQLDKIAEEKSVAVPSPRIAVVDEEDGARLKNKAAVSRLPYMNRNPAVQKGC